MCREEMNMYRMIMVECMFFERMCREEMNMYRMIMVECMFL
jgi:hypothetical protein